MRCRRGVNHYRTLVGPRPDAILLVDTRGDIRMANERGAMLLGYSSPDDLIGIPMFELIAPEVLEKARENHRKRLTKEATPQFRYRIPCPEA